MDAASKVRWGIIGPGTIARAFAAGVERSTSGRLVALGARDPGKPGYSEHFPGRPGADAGGAARRSGGRCGLYRHAASAARRMGDQGGRSRQARAGGEALRHDGLGGRRHVPCGAAGGHLHGRSVHVPVPPADREAPRSDRGRHDRRGQDDQVELRLRHAGFRSDAPALFQRDRGRGHPRCRVLSGVDGAAGRGRGGRQAVPRPGEGRGRGAHRAERGRRVGLGGPGLFRRHRRRGLLLGLAAAGQHAADLWHRGADRGGGLLVRLRQAGRHRGHRDHRPRRDGTGGGGGGGPLALCVRGGRGGGGDPGRPAGVRRRRG